MPDILNITNDSVLSAIELISQNPTVRNGRESVEYDLVYEGQKYPPVLVLSEANKILGGKELTIRDFANSVGRAFKILKDLGFEVQKRNGIAQSEKNIFLKEGLYVFDHLKFYEDAGLANLMISEQLNLRFIASLLSKNFVILTGLSGSGKTKIALAFTKWLCGGNGIDNRKKTFSHGEEIKSNRVIYRVFDTDYLSVTFIQMESGTKVTLPYELIYEWIAVIKEHDFSPLTGPREIRTIVDERTKYSPQLNSFETHLKAAAFHLINAPHNAKEVSPQVCVVPVGADWTNREPLLGYPNALDRGTYILPENGALKLLIEASKKENRNNPYFLILDEMNLSHVERYFSDFLSAMESGEEIPLHNNSIEWKDDVPATVKIPDNFFIIGTVNIDETTYMFSPKVLDRANVIEFRVTRAEMSTYLSSAGKLDLNNLNGAGSSMAANFVDIARDRSLEPVNKEAIIQSLLIFFNELKKTGAEFGYRTAAEILRFVAVVNKVDSKWATDEIIDAAIMQKLLPKVHGSRRKLEPVLKKLGELCLKDIKIFDEYIKSDEGNMDNDKIKYPLSMEKVARMYRSLFENGFTSYAEA